MELVRAKSSDFEQVKAAYIDIIEHTENIEKTARWEYGKHPTDRSLMDYISNDILYLLKQDGVILGLAVVTLYQDDMYEKVEWITDAGQGEIAVIHLLGVLPDCQGSGIGRKLVKEILKDLESSGVKVCRLDTLESNIPAQRFYEGLGFVYRGRQYGYAENTGWLHFFMYEYALEGER